MNVEVAPGEEQPVSDQRESSAENHPSPSAQCRRQSCRPAERGWKRHSASPLARPKQRLARAMPNCCLTVVARLSATRQRSLPWREHGQRRRARAIFRVHQKTLTVRSYVIGRHERRIGLARDAADQQLRRPYGERVARSHADGGEVTNWRQVVQLATVMTPRGKAATR